MAASLPHEQRTLKQQMRSDDKGDAASEMRAVNQYDSIDSWDSRNLLGRSYTLYHPLEPRSLIWVFLITLPIIIGFVVAFLDQTLSALFQLKHEHIADPMASWSREDGWRILLCAIAWGCLSAACIGASYLWSRKLAYGMAGRGFPRVLAHLNGSFQPHWGHWRILFSKLFSVIMSVISGIPLDYVGSISEIGAMIGTCSVSRHPLYQKIVPFAKYFRNTRDSQLIIALSIAAATAAAFRSPIGGVAMLVELSALKLNVKLLYRVFISANIAGFVIQILYTHYYGFKPRSTFGGWDMSPLSQLAQVTENLATALPAIFLGVVGGLFQGVFAIASNFILNRPQLKTIHTLLAVSFIHGMLVFMLSGVFGIADACRPFQEPASSYVKEGTPPFLHTSMFCDQKYQTSLDNNNNNSNTFVKNGTMDMSTTTANATSGAAGNATQQAVYVNAFASLTLGFDSGILRLLFRRSVPQFWTASELAVTAAIYCVMLPFLTVLSIVDGDLIMPTGLLGGCIGQLVFLAMRAWGVQRDWVDGGLFALLGAVSFIGGMTRLTFSLTFLFVDYAGDVRHVLFIMMAISVARAVADRVSPVRIDYVIMKHQGATVLDFALRVQKYDSVTLHEFQQRDLRVIPPTATVGQLTRLLKNSFHNAFPVIDPTTKNFIGLIQRRTLQLLVWGFSDSVPSQLQHPEDWIGIVPAAAAAAGIVSTHNLYHRLPNSVTESSALHSICLTAPNMHNPRQHFESFFSAGTESVQEQHNTDSPAFKHPHVPSYLRSPPSTPNSPTAASIATAAPSHENHHAASAAAAAASSSSLSPEAPQPLQEDYDRFDEALAALEFHRLRDLDDYICHRFAEDESQLLQFSQGIRPERSSGHIAFVAEASAYPKEIQSTLINLVRYTDRSSFTVRASMCVSRLYNMFTVMGLTHATIVDYKNRPTGVITRRDLMTHKIVEKKNKLARFALYSGGRGGDAAAAAAAANDADGDVPVDDDKIGHDEVIRSGAAAAAEEEENGGGVRASGVFLSRFFDDDDDKAKLLTPSDLPASPKEGGTDEQLPSPLHKKLVHEEQIQISGAHSALDPYTTDAGSDVGSSSYRSGRAESAPSPNVRTLMYKVNHMRPPMLLPKGWGGFGVGNHETRNNGNTVRGGGGAAVNNNRAATSITPNSSTDEVDAMAGRDPDSYNTIVSDAPPNRQESSK